MGSGAPHRLLVEQLKLEIGASANLVLYLSSGPVIQYLLAGRVAFAFEGTSAISAHLEGERIRPLASTAEQRFAVLPRVQTTKELGFPRCVVTNC